MLEEALASVGRGGRGAVVVVCGEAGVGKTALLRSFCDEVARPQRVLWGTCDPLFTPRPFGPLFAIAEGTGGELGPALAQGANPHQVALALARELRSPPPALLVLEDLHWADEATLDVFTLLVRRAEAARPWWSGPTATMPSRTPTHCAGSWVSWLRQQPSDG